MNETKTLFALLHVMAFLDTNILVLEAALAKAGLLTHEEFQQSVRAALRQPGFKKTYALLGEDLQDALKHAESLPDDVDLQHIIDKMRWPTELDEHIEPPGGPQGDP